MNPPSGRRLGRRLVFAFVAGVAVLSVAEGLARVVFHEAVYASIPSDAVATHIAKAGDLVYDPVLGWKRSVLPNPGLGLESHGFRHPELTEDKPAGRLRGFVLGDSQTFGAGVDPGQDYPSVAETTLRARGLDVEVVNGALAGYKSIQAYRLIETKLLAFHPDFVVVDCIPGDVDDVRETGPVVTTATSSVERVLFYSRLYRGLRLLLDETRSGHHSMRDATHAQGESWRPAATREEGLAGSNHDLIQALGEARGFEVYFLDYPFTGTPVRSLAPAELLPDGARVVPATAALRASGKAADALFLDNNHMSATGNAIVGAALADALEPCLRARADGRACP